MIEKETFYKLARPNGFDFYTGKTINYREHIGKEVICPNQKKGGSLCSNAFIYASREPNHCFIGASIPCSAYLVSGIPLTEDEDKCGFKKIYIEKELNPSELFDWNYTEACNPINPFSITPPGITSEIVNLLYKWASVWDSVWASVRASVWASVWDSVWDSVGDSVWDSVRDSVRESVRASVWDLYWAYIGSFFSLPRKSWKHTEHIEGEGYPFQSSVVLWKMGLVPSCDGKIWRLHGGEKGEILWERNKRMRM